MKTAANQTSLEKYFKLLHLLKKNLSIESLELKIPQKYPLTSVFDIQRKKTSWCLCTAYRKPQYWNFLRIPEKLILFLNVLENGSRTVDR